MINCKSKADLPYPDTKITTQSMYEIRLLMPVYGGRESEMTAIMNYVYQGYVLGGKYPEIADCLLHIGMTEMEHHEMLGNAITMLGGTPYIGGNHSYWQGSYVNYSKDLKTILQNDIADEKQAVRDYKDIIATTKMPEIVTMVQRIIEDELVHIETLTAILQGLDVQPYSNFESLRGVVLTAILQGSEVYNHTVILQGLEYDPLAEPII